MNHTLSVLLKDGYKVGHKFQYPDDTLLIYSNLTPRSSRLPGINRVMSAGFQPFVIDQLQDDFSRNFFDLPLDDVLARYKRRIQNYLGAPLTSYDHIADLHKLGYLPLLVKAIPEGLQVPLRVPLMTVKNTRPDAIGDKTFFWLTNMLETHLSNCVWSTITVATIAYDFRLAFERYARLTGADPSFCKFQGHDFSYRGIGGGPYAAQLVGIGHLFSFVGTDTIPAIDMLERCYGADSDRELVGCSIPATEHSVECMNGLDEYATIKRLITEIYPTGYVSRVCDTWDYWGVLTDVLPRLRSEIMGRDGKLVVRPDSGDPVDIVAGTHASRDSKGPLTDRELAAEIGSIAWLYEVFGGRVNAAGYKELDPHIGLIYGDSINRERRDAICGRLMANGFASTNWVAGIGSFTYQYSTRDTFGLAMKKSLTSQTASHT